MFRQMQPHAVWMVAKNPSVTRALFRLAGLFVDSEMRWTANSFALVRFALVPQLRPAVRCCASTTGGVNGALQEVRGRLSSAVTSGSLSASVRTSPAH
jgi:hypothetical protein